MMDPAPAATAESDAIDFLVVIPAYREHLRLPPFLRELLRVMDGAPFTVRIAIIDDGSPSAEREAMLKSIQQLTDRQAVAGNIFIAKPLHLPVNTGKGKAILHAWRHHQHGHRWLAFVDADGAVPAAEVLRVLHLIATTVGSDPAASSHPADCYAATREPLPGALTSSPRKVRRNALRRLLGKAFSTLANALLYTGVSDTQCGFKILSHNAFRTVEPHLQGRGLCFDIELLTHLRRANLTIREIPIDWREVPGGTVSVWRHGLCMLFQLWNLYRNSAGRKI